ncbi:MAG: TonB-dependent receptor [Ferruginibacter sp.]|nr:TonB-dependent receptor [Ferruginibacter sp.]
MKKAFYFLLAIQLLVISFVHAQGRVVTGQVSDSTGDAIAGVTVIEKGIAGNGTSTNASGNFKLTLKGASGVIIITNVGYAKQEIQAGNKSSLSITLKNETGSNESEVVVVGYARQKRITLTGAVSSISGAQLRENPSASLQNTLSGRLPGFFSQQTSGRPGGDGATFFIRGQSSYNAGSNSPLIIVDDIEFNIDQFSRLDPNEIESLSILKDASTTAIFGIKGANGVVVVTTRRGKTGPPKIGLRLENSLMQPTKIPHFLGSYESAKLYNQAQINDNALNPVAGFTPRFSDLDLELYQNGKDPYGHPNVDWRKELFKKFSKQYRVNFDISGGTEKVKYFISAGYLSQDGILKNYSKGQDVNGNYYHKRYNYRSNLDMKITRTTDLRLDLSGNIGEINNPNAGSPFGYNDVFYEYSSFLSLSPFAYPIYNPNGTYGYSNWQRSTNPGGGNYNTNNIIGRLTHYGYNRNFENNMNLIMSANQKLDFITRGMSFKATLSYASSYGNSRSETRPSFPSFIYDPVANTYEPRDANVFRVTRFFLGYGAGSTIRTINVQGILNYDRTFGKHRIYGLALVSQSSVTRANSDPVYNFIGNNFRGFTGRLGYNYKQKYLFEFNNGYNGSDRFSADRRYGFFPAVSVGWNVSEELFFKNNVKFINKLKLRGSYGFVGNDKIGDNFRYYYQQTYSFNGTANLGTQSNQMGGILEGSLSNNQVTWEKEKKFDLGLEFSMFNDKLSASVDYFDNERSDILTTRGTVSAVFGQTLPPVNLGIVNNRGYEIELNYAGKIGKDFSYRLKGTYSVAKNKILFQDEPKSLYGYQSFTGNSIGQQLVYTWIGFYQDSADISKSPVPATPARPGDLKYADLNGDGKINGFDLSVTGDATFPNTTGGLLIGLTYKNFSVNAFFQGAMNFNMRGTAEAIRAFASNAMYIHTQSWTPALGNNALYPRLSLNGGLSDPGGYPSTFWFVKGDYIRLKTSEIAYSIPKKFVQRLKMQDIRIYTNGYNLFTWTKLAKRYELDPEISSNTDRINYPPQRTYNFGISATF